jgi:hypothetical protein
MHIKKFVAKNGFLNNKQIINMDPALRPWKVSPVKWRQMPQLTKTEISYFRKICAKCCAISPKFRVSKFVFTLLESITLTCHGRKKFRKTRFRLTFEKVRNFAKLREFVSLEIWRKFISTLFSIEEGGGVYLPGPLCPMVTEPLALTTDRAPMFIVLYYSSTDLYYHHMT